MTTSTTWLRSLRLTTAVGLLALALVPGHAAESAQRNDFQKLVALYPEVPPRLRSQSGAELEATFQKGDPAAALVLSLRLFQAQPPQYESACRWLDQAAGAGLASAQYLAGFRAAHQSGENSNLVLGDYETARDWWEKAARQKHVAAGLDLARLYYFGQLERDYAEAAKWFQAAAAAGSAEAMVSLGQLYQWRNPGAGDDASPDRENCVRWYRKAAEADDANGQFMYAKILALGFGAPRDPAGARIWTERAVQRGSYSAQLVQNDLVPIERLASLDFPLEAPTPSSPADRWEVGDVPADRLQAHAITLRRAANQEGSPHARLLLGRWHELQARTEEQFEVALANYATARSGGYFLVDRERLRINLEANRGIIRIAANPAYAPQRGLRASVPGHPAEIPDAALRMQLAQLWWAGSPSLPANRTNAVYWFLEAARAGSPAACVRLGDLWSEGLGGEGQAAEAVRWWRQAARLNDADGQWRFGHALAQGEGVDKNPLEACVWLSAASAQGNQEAGALLREVRAGLSEPQRQELKARLAKPGPKGNSQ